MAPCSARDVVGAFSTSPGLHELELLGARVDELRRCGVPADIYQKLEALRLAIVAARDLHAEDAVGRLPPTVQGDFR